MCRKFWPAGGDLLPAVVMGLLVLLGFATLCWSGISVDVFVVVSEG